jgi:hypothetical protein
MVPWKSLSNKSNQFTKEIFNECMHGLLGDKLIRPFVFDNNLTGDMYEFFLRNELPGLLEAVSLMVRGKMYLQHDGAPHITLGM